MASWKSLAWWSFKKLLDDNKRFESKFFRGSDMKDELDNICEECKKEDESVSQNLIKHGYKICNYCYTSKTIFPV